MIRRIDADWPAPARVQAFTTLRSGGVSTASYASMNLALHVGDDPQRVQENRQSLLAVLPVESSIQWLQQCHGNRVVRAADTAETPEADACWTDTPGVACAVLTADCLPVLLCDEAGTVVAAVHAGWRGLQRGIVESTVKAMSVQRGGLMAWLGPAIGPDSFEVGPEVREAFLCLPWASADALAGCFLPSGRRGHYLADLYSLARCALAAVGVDQVFGGGRCTLREKDLFYSYRRTPETGRMASIITLNIP